METTLGVGIIGNGIRGRHGYEHFLRAHPAVRLRALAQYPEASPGLLEGKTEDDFRRYAEGLGVAYLGYDVDALLAREDIQVVSMMVEPGLAAEYVERIAAAGKHIVSDKPMAGSVAQGRRIVESVRRHAIQFMVALNERYSPPFREAQRRLASGGVGELLAATVTFCLGGPLAGFTGNAAYRESFGGGEWANFGCYCADYMNWLAGSRPVSVCGHMGTFFYDDYREAGMEDLAECVVRYESGVIGTLLAGRPRAAYAAGYVTADLTCAGGSLRVNGNMPLLEITAGQYGRRGYGSTGLNELCGDFVEAVLQDGPSPIPAEDGLLALQVVHAAYESARTGQPVDPLAL
ncbi:Gfo/Idh/MocA family oxidoreductase [bacterium]|nr:Gfo/Idh/MocA family oxidoreductase [bacterium]